MSTIGEITANLNIPQIPVFPKFLDSGFPTHWIDSGSVVALLLASLRRGDECPVIATCDVSNNDTVAEPSDFDCPSKVVKTLL